MRSGRPQVTACEKILAAKPTPEQARAAVRMKVAAPACPGPIGRSDGRGQA